MSEATGAERELWLSWAIIFKEGKAKQSKN